jgi:tellurium resistance protein TerD
MSSLVLNLTKPGDVTQKLQLNLEKDEEFKVRLMWKGSTDLDLHALVTYSTNENEPAKASSFEDVLSPYNLKRIIRGQEYGILVPDADGSFSIHGGALMHGPDVIGGGEEWLLVRPTKLIVPTGGRIEIPLLSMIHPQGKGKTFGLVDSAGVIIENSNGDEVLNASLSKQFASYFGVQMGSIVVDANGSWYESVGVGFNSDFNGVLGHFS